MSEIDAVRQEFVQLWGVMAPFWGISPTTAKVYSWLLSMNHPADTDEIMHGLEMSRGGVSMACRWRPVHRTTPRPGKRRPRKR